MQEAAKVARNILRFIRAETHGDSNTYGESHLRTRFMRVEAYDDSTRDLTEVGTYGGFHALQESRRKVTL